MASGNVSRAHRQFIAGSISDIHLCGGGIALSSGFEPGALRFRMLGEARRPLELALDLSTNAFRLSNDVIELFKQIREIALAIRRRRHNLTLSKRRAIRYSATCAAIAARSRLGGRRPRSGIDSILPCWDIDEIRDAPARQIHAIDDGCVFF